MSPQQIKSILPNASKSLIDLNSDSEPSGAKLKHAVRDGSLAKTKRKDRDSGRYDICITSYRVRAVDPDNLCGKWFVDSLRYAGVIPDDTSADILYSITQKKVTKKEQEKTLIQIKWPA